MKINHDVSLSYLQILSHAPQVVYNPLTIFFKIFTLIFCKPSSPSLRFH
jgi:hypothetical protein